MVAIVQQPLGGGGFVPTLHVKLAEDADPIATIRGGCCCVGGNCCDHMKAAMAAALLLIDYQFFEDEGDCYCNPFRCVCGYKCCVCSMCGCLLEWGICFGRRGGDGPCCFDCCWCPCCP